MSTLLIAAASSVATSEAEPLPPSSAPSPTVFEYDVVELDTTAAAGQGFSGQSGSSIALHTTAQPGAESTESYVQIELFPGPGGWPGDVTLEIADTRTNRVWTAQAQAGSGPVFLEIDGAYENCWGQGFVPSCDSGFEAVLTAPSGTSVTWDARLVGDADLGQLNPRLIGEIDTP